MPTRERTTDEALLKAYADLRDLADDARYSRREPFVLAAAIRAVAEEVRSAARDVAALREGHLEGDAVAGAEETRERVRQLEAALAEERFKAQQLSDAYWRSSAGDNALRDIAIPEAEIAAIRALPAKTGGRHGE